MGRWSWRGALSSASGEAWGCSVLSVGREEPPWHLVRPRAREALLRLPRCLADSGDSLCRLLRQLGWVRQDGGGGAQVPEGAQHRCKEGED